ncbi:MAG: hypothetical protein IJS50_03830 [Desulfovibrio sp.]|nr:hypothetical protein [Desulfovibrio sp.]
MTGMRKRALCKLKWSDCDFENKASALCGKVAKKRHSELIPMNDLAFGILQLIENSDSEDSFLGKD